MHELEIPHQPRPADDLTDEVKARFHDFDAEITAVSVVPWAEHCTECAIPTCYTSCDLYEARADGRCRRFEGGAARIADAPGHERGLVRIAFKRWAQLMARGSAELVPIGRARRVERLFRGLEWIVRHLPDWEVAILGRRSATSRLLARLKLAVTRSGRLADSRLRPDYFLVEVWNPAGEAVSLTLRLWNPASSDGPGERPPFEERLVAEPGFRRFKVGFRGISPHLDRHREVRMQLIPNEDPDVHLGGARVLYFGTIGFVADARWQRHVPAHHADSVKVVAWDLDGTIWDGVLLEDGPEGVKLRPEVARVIEQLDARGILNTVVSKNEPEDALAQLRRYGLEEYFVFPRIGWGPKSEALAAIARDFDVGSDTLAFVDDSAFERDQVRQADPAIRVIDAAEAAELPARPEFDPPVTGDARRRREFYRGQEARTQALVGFSGEYRAFLRGCHMRLVVRTDAERHAERLHELVQRTNQLNFSGNRYERTVLEKRLRDPAHEAFALECTDRFGEYGLVGFALVERNGPRLLDLALSCRVQGKRVEHAFLGFLLARYRATGATSFEAIYRPTERNRPAGAVFADLGFDDVGFDERAREDQRILYRFDLGRDIPDDGLVDVRVLP